MAVEKTLRRKKLRLKLNDAARNGDSLKLRVTIEKPTGIGKSGATLYVAIADGAAETQGRVLKHAAVVRSLIAVGNVGSEDFSKEVAIKIPAGTGVAGLRIVAFVQDRATGQVLGIAPQWM